jgi:Cell wall-active antibiotics response 4TMS YvqF
MRPGGRYTVRGRNGSPTKPLPLPPPCHPLRPSPCPIADNTLALAKIRNQMDDNRTRDDKDDKPLHHRSGRIWVGLFLLLIGGVLLLDQMGFPLPDMLFNWHTFLIALGLFIGFRRGFRGAAWLILILVGGVYTLKDYYPGITADRFLLPGILIVIGITIVLSPHRGRWRHDWRGPDWKSDDWRNEWHRRHWNTRFTAGSSRESFSSEDFIDTTAIFGGVHKKIVSKNFKGGDITTMMGGTELDLSQADFTGTIRLDITQIMGGTKIIVPPHWEVRSEITALFAGFEDKRQQPSISNPEKVLIIDGTSIFGGIELKNF